MKRVVVILLALVVTAPTFAQQPDPVAVVAHVLDLSGDQITAWSTILHAREAALQPIAQQAQAKQEAIGQALAGGNPDPLTVGSSIIDLNRLQGQIAAVNAQSTTEFEKLLTPDQLQRLEAIRGASQVCQVVPAFQATGLQ